MHQGKSMIFLTTMENTMNYIHKITSIEQLIRDIHVEVKRRGWTLRELADFLHISYIYMASMSNGARKLSGLSMEKQRMLAGFLGISLVDFYLKCGVLQLDDINQYLQAK